MQRELNYHLAQLFNDGVLVKRNREYFLSPALLMEYVEFHGLSQVGDAERKVSTSEAVTGQQVATDGLSREEQEYSKYRSHVWFARKLSQTENWNLYL